MMVCGDDKDDDAILLNKMLIWDGIYPAHNCNILIQIQLILYFTKKNLFENYYGYSFKNIKAMHLESIFIYDFYASQFHQVHLFACASAAL